MYFPFRLSDFNLHTRNAVGRSEKSTFTLSRSEGSGFACMWDFGDHTSRLNITYDHFLTTKGVTSHRYDTIGTYKLTVKCTNRISTIVLDSSVSVYVPVSVFKVR